MKPVFLSYRRTWQAEVQDLAESLHLRGLRIFMDTSDQAAISGPAFCDALRRVIRLESVAMLLHVTADIADSPAIWNVEVPTALDRASTDPDFFIVPFFRDLEPAALGRCTPYGYRLTACNGIPAIPEAGVDLAVFLKEKHAAAALLLLDRLLKDKPGPLSLCLQTRDIGPVSQDADIFMDWRSVYPAGLPSASGCDSAKTAVREVAAAISRTKTRQLEIQAKAHLSAGVLLGATFSSAAGFELRVQQGNAMWSSTGPVNMVDLDVVQEQLNPVSHDICLTIAISRPEIVAGAERAQAKLGITCGGRIVIKPREGSSRDSVPSAAHARDIARKVAATLMDARAVWGNGTVHLFISTPFALAVFVGQELNAFSPMVVYEHDKESNDYSRAFVI
jgi:hypothetical protein